MLQEFKNFAIKGNVIDMAVGIVIGTAFGKIVSSFVSDIIMPPIGMLTGGVDFSNLTFVLKNTSENVGAITLNYGIFINTVVDFVIIAFAIFIVIKQINRFKKNKEEEAKLAEPNEEILLLREIRDSLKKN